MDNRKALETFYTLGQIDNEKGLPIKFDYGLGKIITALEPIAKNLQKVRERKIDGQEDYEQERSNIYDEVAEKDENGRPKRKQVQSGVEWEIKDWPTLNARLKELKEKNTEVVDAMAARVKEYNDLLDQELEGFETYKINIKHLPVNKEGICQLSALQIRFLIPFLSGDIDDLPDYEKEEDSKE